MIFLSVPLAIGAALMIGATMTITNRSEEIIQPQEIVSVYDESDHKYFYHTYESIGK